MLLGGLARKLVGSALLIINDFRFVKVGDERRELLESELSDCLPIRGGGFGGFGGLGGCGGVRF